MSSQYKLEKKENTVDEMKLWDLIELVGREILNYNEMVDDC